MGIRVKDKGCQEVERRQDKGKANDEWLYSGSTMNDERRKGEGKLKLRQR